MSELKKDTASVLFYNQTETSFMCVYADGVYWLDIKAFYYGSVEQNKSDLSTSLPQIPTP